MIVEVDGTATTVETEYDGDEARITIEREHSWQFHVENLRAALVETTAPRRCPGWLKRLVLELGIEEVVVE